MPVYFLWFCRIVLGITFVFSGLLKANDPVIFFGTTDEYLSLFHLSVSGSISATAGVAFILVEIFAGTALILGIRPFLVSALIFIFLVFFVFLTGYSAWTGKMKDCGCFGELLRLKPFYSFLKDIFLLVLSGYLFINRRALVPLLRPEKLRNLILVLSLISGGYVLIYSYRSNPVLEFGDFRTGNRLPEKFICRGTAEDFKKGKILLVIIYDIGTLHPVPVELSKLSDIVPEIHVTGVCGNTREEMRRFSDEFPLPFPLLSCDRDILRLFVRFPLSYVALMEGQIIRKWNSRNFPEISKLMNFYQ